MSGIAGILRRDGREVPEKWVQLLEGTLGGVTWRFEDSVPIAAGNLEVLLLSSERGGTETTIGSVGAMAAWNPETLEITLSRKGNGKEQLYVLNLGEAGDGVLFCSNPMPLLQIATSLELPNRDVVSATQRFLQLGFVTGTDSLLSPVQPVPLEFEDVIAECGKYQFKSERSSCVADDVRALVKQLGQPFADYTLLSRLWKYRDARQKMATICDGIQDSAQRLKETKKLSRWESVLAQLPKQKRARDWSMFGITTVDTVFDVEMIQSITGHRYETPICPKDIGSIEERFNSYNRELRNPDCVLRGIDAVATIADIEVEICDGGSLTLESYPITSWLRSPQSSLGELAGDTFNTNDAFYDLPIDKKYVLKLLDSHQKETSDYTSQLFSLLTLALWSELVHA